MTISTNGVQSCFKVCFAPDEVETQVTSSTVQMQWKTSYNTSYFTNDKILTFDMEVINQCVALQILLKSQVSKEDADTNKCTMYRKSTSSKLY